MKKKKTLSTQLTLVISFIVLLIVGVFWMANNTLLEKYYAVSFTPLRAHDTASNIVCSLMLEKKHG